MQPDEGLSPPPLWIAENSPSRARTCDLAVNSRSLYLLSYRGIALGTRRCLRFRCDYRRFSSGFQEVYQDFYRMVGKEKRCFWTTAPLRGILPGLCILQS